MRTKQEIEKWLMSLVNQNMAQPHEELVNPAELSAEDVRYLYYTINNSHLLNIVAQDRDEYTNHVFFTWFFKLAARIPCIDLINMFAFQLHNKQNVLQLLFINDDAHSVALWMAWATPLLREFKVNPAEIFRLLSQKCGYYALGNGVSSQQFLVFLVHQRRDLFKMLMNWMNELYAQVGNLVNETMISVLQTGNFDSLFEDLISVRDQQCLTDYLLFIQNLFAAEAVSASNLLELIYCINDPKHYTKKLAAISPNLKHIYDDLVSELLFASAQNGNQLKNRFEALCHQQPLVPITIKNITLSDEELRPLLLKYIDRLPPNERPDAFNKALDKKNPFGKYMLQKGWFTSADEKAFEEKIKVLSKWQTQTMKARLTEGGRPIHAVLFQPSTPKVNAIVEERAVMRNNN